MSGDRKLPDLERRLSHALHQAAPRPDAHLAERLLSHTATAPQRRGWSPFTTDAGALAVAAVVVLAVLTGLALGQLPGNVGIGPDATESPSAVASETPATIAPTPSETPPSPSPSAARLPDPERCTNGMLGYEVSYPADWYANAEIEQEFGDPIPACTYFGSQPMDIAPNAGVPPAVAISFERWTEVPPAGEGWQVVSREQTSVAGLPAVATEQEQASDAGAPFSAAGDRTYGYEVELPDGTVLTASTGTTADGDYAEHKDVLDQMMATVELTGDGRAREPLGARGPLRLGPHDGYVIGGSGSAREPSIGAGIVVTHWVRAANVSPAFCSYPTGPGQCSGGHGAVRERVVVCVRRAPASGAWRVG